MIARIKFASALLVGSLVLGCNNSAPPEATFNTNPQAPGAAQTNEVAAAEKEVTEKGAANVSQETIEALAPVAGHKGQKMKQGGGN